MCERIESLVNLFQRDELRRSGEAVHENIARRVKNIKTRIIEQLPIAPQDCKQNSQASPQIGSVVMKAHFRVLPGHYVS
jgi:hypothetical protein